MEHSDLHLVTSTASLSATGDILIETGCPRISSFHLQSTESVLIFLLSIEAGL